MCYLIGITGSSGGGKSDFGKMLNSKLPNSRYLDCDVWLPTAFSATGRDRLTTLFGAAIFHEDGTLNAGVFCSGEEEIKQSNAIIDSYIFPRTKEYIEASKESAFVLVDFMRLPVCAEVWNACEKKILVEAPEDDRLERLIVREPRYSKSQFKRRDATGVAFDKCNADIVVTNNSTLEALESKAEEIAELIKSELHIFKEVKS